MPRPAKLNAASILLEKASGMSNADIARAHNVTPGAVTRALARVPGGASALSQTHGLKALQELLRDRLPLSERVDRLVQIVKAPDDPSMDTSGVRFASLNASRYVNELDGIHPELETAKVKRDNEEARYQPMFALPQGTRVSVTMTVESSPDPTTIDVTPEESDS